MTFASIHFPFKALDTTTQIEINVYTNTYLVMSKESQL